MISRDPSAQTVSQSWFSPSPGSHSPSLNQELLRWLTGHTWDEQLAQQHWEAIIDHRVTLERQLQRPVHFFTATLDYLSLHAELDLQNFTIINRHYLNNLLEQSMRDGLTRLYNHQTFLVLLEHELALAHRKQQPLSLVMADIDDFKNVNDEYGHLEGDAVLRSVAEVFHKNIRNMDVACRYGGEEFALALPDTSIDKACDIAKRIGNDVSDLDMQTKRISLSIGIADFSSEIKKKEQLIQLADASLYRAKHLGKNRIEVHTKEKFASSACHV